MATNPRSCCCFFGNICELSDKQTADLKKAAIDLILNEGVHEFQMAPSIFSENARHILCGMKEEFPAIHTVLVLPYITKYLLEDIGLFMEAYDDVRLADIMPCDVHEEILDKSDEFVIDSCSYVICCTDGENADRTAKAIHYAKQQNKQVINI